MKGRFLFQQLSTFHMSTHLLLPLLPFLATNKNCHSLWFNSTLQSLSFAFPYLLCLNFHKTLAFSLQFLATMHSSCFMCDCWSFWAPCVRKPGSWARSLCRLRVVNTWEGFYLLSDVVDPGWRAVAQIRSLGFPDTVRCKTPESCNTCNMKVTVFSVTGWILPPALCIKVFWELISAQVLSWTPLSHLSVLVFHHLGPLRALRHKRPMVLYRNIISNLANSSYRQRTCRKAARY